MWWRRARRRLVAWLYTDNWLDKHFPAATNRPHPGGGMSDHVAAQTQVAERSIGGSWRGSGAPRTKLFARQLVSAPLLGAGIGL